MDKEIQKLKLLADFAISGAYQTALKPYMTELLEKELEVLDIDPQSEWQSLKRDLSLMAVKRTISNIINKIDNANEELSKKLANKNQS